MRPNGLSAAEGRERLISLTLALEEALAREAWDEADDLFAARDGVLAVIPAHAVPHEIDEIDARILARLQRGQAEIRRETMALSASRRAATSYAGARGSSTLLAA